MVPTKFELTINQDRQGTRTGNPAKDKARSAKGLVVREIQFEDRHLNRQDYCILLLETFRLLLLLYG